MIKKILLVLFFSVNVVAKQPLNILFVVGHFPVISETFVFNQITGLIDREHIVDIHAFKRRSIHKVHKEIIEYDLLNKATYGRAIPSLRKYDIVYCQFGPQVRKLVTKKLKNIYFEKGTHRFLTYILSQKLKYKTIEIITKQNKRTKCKSKYNSIFRRTLSFMFWYYMIKLIKYNFDTKLKLNEQLKKLFL